MFFRLCLFSKPDNYWNHNDARLKYWEIFILIKSLIVEEFIR